MGKTVKARMGIPQYFSATYPEARGKFAESMRAANAAAEAYVNPNAKGALGEELAVDVARFGDMEAKCLLIVCSGTHGNEGFCGPINGQEAPENGL
jgi:hypothetical protein